MNEARKRPLPAGLVLVAVLALSVAACTDTAESPTTVTTVDTGGSTTTDPEESIAPDTIVEGKVSLEQLQPEVSFTTSDRWFVAIAQPGAVALDDVDRIADFTRAALFLNARPFEASSVDEWSEGHEDVSVLARNETVVDGRDGVVYDIIFDGEGEIPFLSAQCCGGRIVLRNSEYYRVWVLDTGGEVPLVMSHPCFGTT